MKAQLRLGIFCFLGRGHLNPAAALGRRLRERGHEVTIFHLNIARAAIRRAELNFYPLDERECAAETAKSRSHDRANWMRSIRVVHEHSLRVLRDGRAGAVAIGVDALIADQCDIAAGSVADSLGIPFVTTCCGPPMLLDSETPAPHFGCNYLPGTLGRLRNTVANALANTAITTVRQTINKQRALWGLPTIRRSREWFSKIAVITQMPTELELPVTRSPPIHYTAQWHDDTVVGSHPFPWHRLNGKPIVFASMGTIRNDRPQVFRTIASACADFDFQLVISLGGNLQPEQLGHLPGHPIVVHFAPQVALLQQAAFVINCAGMNTTLDAIRYGLPIIAIPVAEDQPGVAARIAYAKLGIAIPIRKLSVDTLSGAIQRIISDSEYLEVAQALRARLARVDGAEMAATLVEEAIRR